MKFNIVFTIPKYSFSNPSCILDMSPRLLIYWFCIPIVRIASSPDSSGKSALAIPTAEATAHFNRRPVTGRSTVRKTWPLQCHTKTQTRSSVARRASASCYRPGIGHATQCYFGRRTNRKPRSGDRK